MFLLEWWNLLISRARTCLQNMEQDLEVERQTPTPQDEPFSGSESLAVASAAAAPLARSSSFFGTLVSGSGGERTS